jgi:hypothetical protein
MVSTGGKRLIGSLGSIEAKREKSTPTSLNELEVLNVV